MKKEKLIKDKEFNEAKQLFCEMYGDAISTATYYKIAIVGLILLSLFLIKLNLDSHELVRNYKPMVVRIDDIGRAEVIKYDATNYKPQTKEIKYFLSKFTKLYYQKNKYTIQNDFDTFIKFLDGNLANSLIDTYKQNKTIETFLRSSTTDDVEIKIERILIDNIENPPYKAQVDFQKRFLTARERKLDKTENYTATFTFVFKDEIPEEEILNNPLGLTIVNLREDKAFK